MTINAVDVTMRVGVGGVLVPILLNVVSVAGTGSYALTGTPSSLEVTPVVNEIMTANLGSYAFSGMDALVSDAQNVCFIDEKFSATPLEFPWYDNLNIALDAERYDYTWLTGQSTQEPGDSSRLLFTGSDEINLSFTFQTTSSFPDAMHLFYFKLALASVFEAPTVGFTFYLEPLINGDFYIDTRNSEGTFREYHPTISIDSYDGVTRTITLYAKLNDLGLSNGIIKIWVDDVQTMDVTDLNIKTQVGQQFGQMLLAPHIASIAPSPISAFVDDCVLCNHEIPPIKQFYFWDIDNPPIDEFGNNITIHGFFGGSGESTEQFHSGFKSMKIIAVGDDNGNDQEGCDQGTSPFAAPNNKIIGSDFYYRWWMYIDSGFDWGTATEKTKSSRVAGQSGVDPSGYTGYLRASKFQIDECDSGGGGACPGGGFSFDYDFRSQNDNTWHEYIVRVKMNTGIAISDGELHAWVDGVHVGSVEGFLAHDIDGNVFHEQWGCWMVRPFFQLRTAPGGGGTMYVDDFRVTDVLNSSFPIT